ncbi:hypothetical protein Poli38472_009607 [Pythium oligandrum]|uniref:Thioredoxin domain-containing protein n=1 Tax=Pythium oligandrum TaxID=41045 RepID=A0A8K1FII4_PYTOL|nr:hypothetical protein Poli38472_009607 [Pythium oligandrum]|eukprot:TMW62114.1 hypothetical protein Poli38472_009607 [Pythium oligandrum]
MTMTRRLVGAVCVLLGVSALVQAEYGPKDAVTVLTEQNFEKEVLNSPDFWIVEFYAPWCGHCQKLEPEYKAAAKKLKQQARLGAVDATVHQSLAQKYNIRGYPTIKEFGANKKKPRDYQGGRTRREIIDYVKNSEEAKKLGVSGATVVSLEYNSVHTFLKQDEKTPSAVFFGSKKSGKKKASAPPSWLSSLAQQFMKGKKKKKPTVNIGFVPGTEGKTAKHLGIQDEDLPTVVFVDASGSKLLKFSGSDLKEATAKQFIADNVKATQGAVESWSSVPLFPAPEVAKKAPKVALNELSVESIGACVTKKGKMCVIIPRASESGAGTEDDKIKSLAKRYRRDPFKFLSTEQGSPLFGKLTSALGATGANVLVVKPGRKVKFAAHTGATDENALTSFVDKLVEGSAQFEAITLTKEELEAKLKEDVKSTHEEL